MSGALGGGTDYIPAGVADIVQGLAQMMAMMGTPGELIAAAPVIRGETTDLTNLAAPPPAPVPAPLPAAAEPAPEPAAEPAANVAEQTTADGSAAEKDPDEGKATLHNKFGTMMQQKGQVSQAIGQYRKVTAVLPQRTLDYP